MSFILFFCLPLNGAASSSASIADNSKTNETATIIRSEAFLEGLLVRIASSGKRIPFNYQNKSIKIQDLKVKDIWSREELFFNIDTLAQASNNPIDLETSLLSEDKLINLYCILGKNKEGQIESIDLIISSTSTMISYWPEEKINITFNVEDIEGAENALNRRSSLNDFVYYNRIYGYGETNIEGTDDTNGNPIGLVFFENGICKRILLRAKKGNFTDGYKLKIYLQPES